MLTPDHELLEGVASRDPEAFRELMKRYAGPVVRLAHRFLGNQADAEETAQDVFFRLYEHPPQLDPDGKLFTWIYRVTVNRSLDLLRARKRRPQTVSLDAPPETEGHAPLSERLPQSRAVLPSEQAARTELSLHVRRAVGILPEELRVPLVLSALEAFPHAEIARILRISPKAVERRVARARELLKSRLSPLID